MARYFQLIHRTILPVLFPLIALTAAAGMTYRVGRAWFGMDRKVGDFVLDIHTGGWMGEHLSALYVYVVGCVVIAALVSGAAYLLRRGGGGWLRRSHRVLGLVLLLPLFVTAATGVLYEAGESWLHFPEAFMKLLMNLHEGRWLGKEGKVYYVIVVGGALLSLGIMGLSLWRSRKRAV